MLKNNENISKMIHPVALKENLLDMVGVKTKQLS